MLVEPYALFNEAVHLASLGVRAPLSRSSTMRTSNGREIRRSPRSQRATVFAVVPMARAS